MEKKNLVKTEGGPLYFGLAGALLILISTILQSGVMTAFTNSMFASSGLTIGQTFITVFMLIGFLIYPGIFLILLLTAVNKEKRGIAFSVVWIVFSAINFLSELKNLFAPVAQLKDLSAQLVPGGFYLYSVLGLLGYACVLISCILILQRLHQPPQEPVNSTVDQ